MEDRSERDRANRFPSAHVSMVLHLDFPSHLSMPP